jgi:DNA-binding transcriptional LysR family regulator
MWSTIELREIRTFHTLAEELHFGPTAERLAVTPSRVSQTIRTLETRIGGALFERSSRSVRLTSLGTQLLSTVKPPYEALERALFGAQDAATGGTGQLRFGAYSPVNYVSPLRSSASDECCRTLSSYGAR